MLRLVQIVDVQSYALVYAFLKVFFLQLWITLAHVIKSNTNNWPPEKKIPRYGGYLLFFLLRPSVRKPMKMFRFYGKSNREQCDDPILIESSVKCL